MDYIASRVKLLLRCEFALVASVRPSVLRPTNRTMQLCTLTMLPTLSVCMCIEWPFEWQKADLSITEAVRAQQHL